MNDYAHVPLCLTRYQVMKTYGGSGSVVLRINLGNRRKWVVNFTARPLCPRKKSHQEPLDMRSVGLRA